MLSFLVVAGIGGGKGLMKGKKLKMISTGRSITRRGILRSEGRG
jgi:hypothetical protein